MLDSTSDPGGFNKKISVLCEVPMLLKEDNFDHIKNLKECRDKLCEMSNLHIYIKSEDLINVTQINNNNLYLRLVPDSLQNYKNSEFISPRRENDFMSISESPRKEPNLTNFTSKSSETLMKTKKSRRFNKESYIKILVIDKEKYTINYLKRTSKFSIFICCFVDEVLYCNSARDGDVKGEIATELLEYENVEIVFENKNISIYSPKVNFLTFPIYFIFHDHELTISEFLNIIENIINLYLTTNK